MNNEIKNRIEQIKNGKVPKGYKCGKLGIVPKEWEEVTFSSLFTSSSDYTDDLNTYPLYSLTIEDGITAKTERYDRAHLVKKENSYKIVRPNDFAYNPMNIRFGAVSRHKGSFPIAVSGYYDIFTTVHRSDLLFMDSFLNCGSMLTYYNKMATGSLVEKQRVHFSDFLKFSIPLPPLEEREKIAKILNTQDVVIELTEKRIEQLKQMKKYYLQNMFPKRGETVPKIMFKGFTDAWEQRKFSDITFPSGEKNKDNLPYESYSITNESGFVPQDEKFENGGTMRDADKRMYYIVSPQSFAYNPARINVGSIGYQNTHKNVIVSSLYEVFKTTDDVDDRFLWHWFKSDDFQKLIIQLQEGGVRLYFYYDKLCMGSIALPNLAEQRQIGAYLDKLDNLITLHQRKLEEEKRKKKSLAQLLLSGIVRV